MAALRTHPRPALARRLLLMLWLAACACAWVVLATLPAHATAVQTQNQRPVLLDGRRGELDLSGALATWFSTGTLADDLARLPQAPFEPLAGPVSARFGPEAVWIRFRLQPRDASGTGAWWLEHDPAFVNDLALYRQGPQGLEPMGRMGSGLPFSARPMGSRNTVFALHLAQAGLAETYYLRVSTQTVRSAVLSLRRPQAYAAHAAEDHLIQGLFFGAVAVSLVVNLLLSRWLSSISRLVYTVYIGNMGLLLFISQGLASKWLFGEHPAWHNPTLALTQALVLPLTVEMWRLVNVSGHWPQLFRWSRRLAWGVFGALLLALAAGRYDAVATTAQIGMMLLSITGSALGLVLWRRGEPAAPSYVLAFGMLDAAVLTFTLRNLKLVPTSMVGSAVANLDLSILFMLAHLVLVNLTVVRQVQQLRRASDAAQAELLRLANSTADALEKTVNERTLALQQAVLEAHEANRAKNSFLARVSHDLRSPLTTILGYAQLMQTGSNSSDSAHLRTIRSSASHMLRLVTDLIDYARGASNEQVAQQPFYLYALLDEVASEARLLAARRHNQFTLVLDPALPAVLVGDPHRLRQVLVNLLQNAAKFTEHGQISLQVRPAGPLADDGRLPLQLAVADTGCGMAQEDLAQVFEPFYRAAGTAGSEGIGLGLPIVERWVQRMGGKVTLSSTPGQGTQVLLQLPATPGSEGMLATPVLAQAHHQPEAALRGSGQELWLAEDLPEILALLSSALQRQGFAVRAHADGQALIDRMNQPGCTAPSLVITDLRMLRADGAQVLKAVRLRWPQLPVLLLSATPAAQPEGAPQFDAMLLKPIDFAELAATITRLLGLETTPLPPPRLAEAEPPEPPVGELLPPAADELATLQQWLDLGAVSDVVDWAQALAQRAPAHAAWAQRVQLLASQARLDEVRALMPGSMASA